MVGHLPVQPERGGAASPPLPLGAFFAAVSMTGLLALLNRPLSLTSYWNERKAHETGVVPISSGYTLGFWRGREERGQAQFL